MRRAFASHDVNRAILGLKKQPCLEFGEDASTLRFLVWKGPDMILWETFQAQKKNCSALFAISPTSYRGLLGPSGPRVPESVSGSVPQSGPGLRRVQKVSRECSGVSRHSGDTLGTLFGRSGARGPKGPADTPWDTRARRARETLVAGRRDRNAATRIFLSLHFLEFLAFLLVKEFLAILSDFPFFRKDFRGTAAKEILAFLVVFLAVFQKGKEKEDQGMCIAEDNLCNAIWALAVGICCKRNRIIFPPPTPKSADFRPPI